MATRTISDAGGNWDATAAWTEGVVPVSGDDVVATATSGNLVVNVETATLKSFDLTGYTGTLSGSSTLRLSPATGNTVNCLFAGTITHTGDVKMAPGGTAIINLTCGTKTTGYFTKETGTGQVKQQDAIIATGAINFDNGTWLTNGFNITCTNIICADASGSGTFNCTGSTITCSGYITMASGITLIATNSSISIAGTGNCGNWGGTKIWGTVTFTGNGATIVGNNTFTTLNVNTAGLATGLKVTVDSIQTVTNFATNGYASNLAKILSSLADSHFHLSKAGGGQVSVDYMSIKDSVADQANTWYAGTHSTDVSGNSGWVFTAPPAGGLATLKTWGPIAKAAIKTIDDKPIAELKTWGTVA